MDPMEALFKELYPSFDQRVKDLMSSPDMNYQIGDAPSYQKLCREFVEIRIDPAKCTDPSHCLKCMDVCAPKVFCWEWRPVGPFGGPDGFGIRERPARMWAPHALLCTVCNRCAEHCPEQAITVIPAEQGSAPSD